MTQAHDANPTRNDKWDPYNSPLNGEAWDLIAASIRDGRWHQRQPIELLVAERTEASLGTAHSVINKVAALGWIFKGSGKQSRGKIRVTAAGRALRPELRP